MIWIETPYHGYLKVSVKNQELIESKFEPSKYSFIQNGHWYFEEDIDAIRFMKKVWKRTGGIYLIDCQLNSIKI